LRRELSEFEEDHPLRQILPRCLAVSLEALRRKLFRVRLSRVALGSRSWHVWQQRLSLGAPVGWPAWARSEFYMRTLSVCGSGLFVHPGVSVCFPKNLRIGENVFINRGAFITAPALVWIGTNVMIGPYAVLNSGSHLFVDPAIPIREQGHKELPIKIGENAWIGANAYIGPGVSIGEGAIVGANSVVTRSVPALHVVAGIPARTLFTRGRSRKEGAV